MAPRKRPVRKAPVKKTVPKKKTPTKRKPKAKATSGRKRRTAPTPAPPPVPPHVIEALLEAGHSPAWIVRALGLSVADLEDLGVSSRILDTDDDELRALVRQVTVRVADEALRILEEGAFPQRLSLIRMLLPSMVKAVTGDDSDELASLRSEFEGLLREVQDTPEDGVDAGG